MKIVRSTLVATLLLLSSGSLAATYFSEVGPSGRVKRTVVIPDAQAATGETWTSQLLGGTWKQTFIDGSGPGYAGIGSTYNGTVFKAGFFLSVIGDSIVLNMGAVQSTLPLPFPAAQNLGVSGDKIGQIQARLGSISANATHVILEGGTNDFLQSNDSAIIPGYTAILNALAAKKVILIGIPPIDEAAIDPSRLPQLNNAKIAAMNAQLVTLCASKPNCTMSDVKSMNMTGKTADGFHPIAGEYQEISAVLLSAL